MLVKRLLVIVVYSIIVFATGCATPPLTPEGRTVRCITPEMTQECKFLGPVGLPETADCWPGNCQEVLFNLLKNRVAEMGGDSYVVVNSTATKWGFSAQVDAYRCNR